MINKNKTIKFNIEKDQETIRDPIQEVGVIQEEEKHIENQDQGLTVKLAEDTLIDDDLTQETIKIKEGITRDHTAQVAHHQVNLVQALILAQTSMIEFFY